MITTKIKEEFPEHEIRNFEQSIYISDYSHQTKEESVKRSVEIHTKKPADIESFFLQNDQLLNIGTIIFDKSSFTDVEGKSLSQCECVVFPSQAKDSSWIMFLELKYCEFKNAVKNSNKAINQVRNTYKYYKDKGVIGNRHLVYLIFSLPKQNNTPFKNFRLTQSKLTKLRSKNIIIKGINSAKVKDQYFLDV